MTVIEYPAALAGPPLGRRVWNAVRLHVANPWPSLITPWLIFAAIFGLNLAIWYMVTASVGGVENLDPDAFYYNGGVTWVLFFLMAMAVQSMSLTFRFALGVGMTRRDYFLGTVAYLVLLASMYAAGIALLAQVERLTDGWGVGGRFFAPWFLAELPAWELWYINATAGLLLALLGLILGAVWVRWRVLGLYLFLGAFALLIIAAVWLMTVTDSWAGLGDYLGSHSRGGRGHLDPARHRAVRRGRVPRPPPRDATGLSRAALSRGPASRSTPVPGPGPTAWPGGVRWGVGVRSRRGGRPRAGR